MATLRKNEQVHQFLATIIDDDSEKPEDDERDDDGNAHEEQIATDLEDLSSATSHLVHIYLGVDEDANDQPTCFFAMTDACDNQT